MEPHTWLARMDDLLAAGVARLPEPFRRRHAGCLLAAQRADGGFAGPAGQSDLYYTRFALEALRLLAVDAAAPVWSRASGYLCHCPPAAGVVDCLCFLHAASLLHAPGLAPLPDDVRRDRLAQARELLGRCRTADGGFAAAPQDSPDAGHGGTYHTFLAALCYNLMDESLPAEDRAVQMVLARRADDGGFSELPRRPHGQTNPTAAAVGFLALVRALDQATAQQACGFLRSMQTPDGGFRAHAAAAGPDLLSTFTALYTLASLAALPRAGLAHAARFTRALALDRGGFRAAIADQAGDVEYTFYGLGVLGLLASAAAHR